MVPTLGATLGVKGHRPTVGTGTARTCCTSSRWSTWSRGVSRQHWWRARRRPSRRRARARPGGCRRRSPPTCGTSAGCTRPSGTSGWCLLIDNAPWHRGKPMDEALAENPHLEFKRLPSYSPQLNPIERFWKMLRRRATHNRLFDTPGGPEAVDPQQPLLLPDISGTSSESGRPVLHPPRKPERIGGFVNERMGTRSGEVVEIGSGDPTRCPDRGT